MSRTGLNELVSVQDPLQTWNWDLFLPSIPGSGLGRDLQIKCVSTSIPGSSLEQVGLEAHGVKLNFAGRRTWTGTWNATFFESRDGTTRRAFMNWKELARSWKNNSGAYKSEYAVSGEISLYDDLPQEVQRIRLIGLFVQQVDEPALDQTSGIIQYNVTFSYDYTEDLL